MASSETRTNITATDFTLTFPSGLQALEGYGLVVILRLQLYLQTDKRQV
jgi:hypothetical protein